MQNVPANSGEDRKEPAYPYYDLETAIKSGEIVRQLGGSKDGVKKSLVAKQVGVAESTPSFFQKLSAAKVFGLIQGWGSYGLTDNGRNYFYPQSQEAQKRALLSLLSTPQAFNFILKRFDGEQLPTTNILGNILHQEIGVTDSWKDRVAQTFVRSANFAGIIDNNGYVRYDAEVHNTPVVYDDAGVPTEVKPQHVEAKPQTTTTKRGISVWQFRQIRLETPEDLSLELWEKLNKYVEILKPSESEGKK